MNCTLCGKCCIQAWPQDLLWAYWTWSEAEVIASVPICAVIRHPQFGGAMRGKNFVWTKEHGLTRSEEDMSCPFLGRNPDGTRPCLLVGTEHEHIFREYCLKAGPTPGVDCG